MRDTADLRDDVKLVNRAKDELNAFISRLRGGDTASASQTPVDLSDESVRTAFVAEAKKSGLYQQLKQAAIQRLKDSGNYEKVISQIRAEVALLDMNLIVNKVKDQTLQAKSELDNLTKQTAGLAEPSAEHLDAVKRATEKLKALTSLETTRRAWVVYLQMGNYDQIIDQANNLAKVLPPEVMAMIEAVGATPQKRDPAWAHNWLDRQFDYDQVDDGFKVGEPYIELYATTTQGAWPSFNNSGTADVYGDKSNVQANGRFDVKFLKEDDQLFYTVQNKATGETFERRSYDPRGTIIEAPGLRAEMFGTPAPGDKFSFGTPPKFQFGYPDATNVDMPLEKQKALHKKYMFDRIIGSAVGGTVSTPKPSLIIEKSLKA